ncbi:MAG TPA: hypothetical protein VN317_08235 [Candidatus Methanoperedens sp.]|nr:hypothetical protein [Candidatus Methanoperedens sp.]
MKNIMALTCILLVGSPTVSIGSVADDQVTSIKIKEADNNGSQDTNSGSGVKTNHIQNLAVTGAKIADGAVTSAKIADGSVAAADLASNAVTTLKIADGAVTDAKILGVSASKVSGTVANADTVDGVHASAFAPASHAHAQDEITGLAESLNGKSDIAHTHQLAKVAIVALSGGDFSEPTIALDGGTLAQWCGTPSSTNRCLLKIMPGIYDLGSGSLNLQGYVDIEGAGEDVTIITSSVDGGYDSGTVRSGGGDSEIRSLTIRNTGTGTYNRAIVNYGAQHRYTHVTAIASGAAAECCAIFNLNHSSSVFTDVTAVATGGTVNLGVRNLWSSVTMNNLTATASAGNQSIGVSNMYSSVSMTNGVAAASGGASENDGVQNVSSATSMNNVTVSAMAGSGLNVGVWRSGTAELVTMTNVTAVAKEGATNYAVYGLVDGNVVVMDRCTLEGSQAAVLGGGGGVVFKIGASKIVGGVGQGIFSCVASYDGNYAPLDATCH